MKRSQSRFLLLPGLREDLFDRDGPLRPRKDERLERCQAHSGDLLLGTRRAPQQGIAVRAEPGEKGAILPPARPLQQQLQNRHLNSDLAGNVRHPIDELEGSLGPVEARQQDIHDVPANRRAQLLRADRFHPEENSPQTCARSEGRFRPLEHSGVGQPFAQDDRAYVVGHRGSDREGRERCHREKRANYEHVGVVND